MNASPLPSKKEASGSLNTKCHQVYTQTFARLVVLCLLNAGLIAAEARVIYVNGSLQTDPVPTGQTWAMAWSTIGDAIKDAGDGDEIWVAQGTYKEFVVITNAVALYGGFAGTETNRDQRDFTWNTTKIFGDGGGTNLSQNVVSILEVTNDLARLDGFTVIKDPKVFGSAIFTTNASPVIANNRVSGLTNYNYGAIQCRGGAPLIVSNFIANCGVDYIGVRTLDRSEAGGIGCYSSDAHIVGNRIVGNKAQTGAGIVTKNGVVVIESNDLLGNAASSFSGGVDCWKTTATISNNKIIGNSVQYPGVPRSGTGMTIALCTNVLIANNLLMANLKATTTDSTNAIGDAGGIYIEGSVTGTLINNTLIFNRGGAAASLWCSSTQVLVLNNIMAFGSSGVGGAPNMPFTNNCVFGNGTNNFVSMSDKTGTNGNISLDPMLEVGSRRPGWHLMSGSPCIGTGETSLVSPDWFDIDGQPRMRDSLVDIGADAFQEGDSTLPPVICHVSPAGDDRNDGLSWANATRTVQTAIDRAVLTGGEVWVATGFYPERITMRPYVDLYGGFAGMETNWGRRDWIRNPTVFDGQGLGSVVQFKCLIENNRLDGFTIQNGLSEIGGGVLAIYSSPIIANNNIRNNTTFTNIGKNNLGGGLYTERCTLVLSNNLIQNNVASAGGGVCMTNDLGDTVVRNAFKFNRANLSGPMNSIFGIGGGGMYAVQGYARIWNNLFISNISTNQASQNINNNFAYGGAISFGEGPISGSATNEIRNNTFIGNLTYGCVESGGVALVNCTNTLCANNLLAYNSSGLYCKAIANIQWLNNCVSSNIAFNYKGIVDQTGTNGNIASNPSLAVPPLPYLMAGSTCINAGIALAAATNELDWTGNPRVVGNAIDIGAVEFSSLLPQLSRSVYCVSTNGSNTNGGHSWLDAKRTVQAGIDAAAADGGEVWVAAGKYAENLVLRPFVSLYGGFKGDEMVRIERNWSRNVTVLDGRRVWSVIRSEFGGDSSVISGFTIQNGAGSGPGGGIYCASNSPTISENRIVGNTSGLSSGIFCMNGAPLVENNLIAYNTNYDYHLKTDGSIVSLIGSPSAKILNNTIVSNKVEVVIEDLGAVYTSIGGSFINNIIAFNNCSGIEFRKFPITGPATILSNNCIYGHPCSNYLYAVPGPGDISVDPLFIEGTSQLSSNSPCIDAGNDSVITPEMLDLAGTPRIQGTHVDIGAYEYSTIPAGEWVDFVPGTESVQVTPVTVGGITYIPWRFEFAESKYRMAGSEAVEANGTNFTGRFHLEQWTGTEAPGTNAFSGTFVLGALNPGDYAIAANASGSDVKTVSFSVPAGRTPTLSWQPRADGALKLQVLGVAEVTYRLLCATNLVNWEIHSTHHGAPFDLDITNNPDIPTLFYRIEIVK